MVAVRVAEVPLESPVDQFLVGDIVQVCFEPTAETPKWDTFTGLLRDNADIAWATELVATQGGSLGMYSAKLAAEESFPHAFRTITPPAPLIVVAPKQIDHRRNSKNGELIGIAYHRPARL